MVMIGYVLYLISSFMHRDFNKGSLYIIASFFVCFALEVKIFMLVVTREVSLKRMLKNDRSIIINIVFQLFAHVFYLSGTVLHHIELSYLTYLPATANIIAGMFLLAAVSTCFS